MGRNVSKIAVGGYPVGAVSGPDCVVVSVMRGVAELLASWLARVGLSVPFHVGPGCRMAVADGLKRAAVAVDGDYTIYGALTGLVEVYEGERLVYVNAGAFGVFRRASLRDPGGGLLLGRPAGWGGCELWVVEWGAVYRLPQVTPLGEGARCVYVSNKGVI